jgi:hypothetical protein
MKPNVVIGPLLALGLVLACSTPTDLCGCPPALGIGTVFGTVTNATGAAVTDAEVRVEARLFGCAATQPSYLVDSPVTRTDAVGRYRYEMRAASPSDSACIRVVARRIGAAAGDSAVASAVRMRLVPSYGPRARPDSVLLNLRLP